MLKTLRNDQLDWSLPAHRRGTLSGMDAAPEPPGTDSRHVLRWWAGKGPAAKVQRRGRGALIEERNHRVRQFAGCLIENSTQRPS
ncbi:hypothetical protein DZD52_16595 [Xanthomonas nasturtii]|uniref:Uncharacterized protein n=1 Tax=Xanthomonas nasturtii TaxID=1843581 RepID=A0A3E1KH16_9XANT|nr:hypothetical protein DZD52_16595 [Xanthomonas nasturtii]